MSVVNDEKKSVTSSNVSYMSEFMKSALMQYEAGVSRRFIWANAGLYLENILPGYFRKALKTRKYQASKAENPDWIEKSRGSKKRVRFSTEREDLEYLREENTLLKEIRALGKKSK